MDGRKPVETRSKTPAHDTAQRCRLQPRQPNARYSPPPSWRSSAYLNPRPRWGTASNGPFERPLPRDTKEWIKEKRSMCPKSLEYINDRKIDTWIKILCSSASCVSIENLQEQSTAWYLTKLLLYVLSCHWCGSARSQHYMLLPVEVQEAQWDHNGIAEYAGEANYIGICL